MSYAKYVARSLYSRPRVNHSVKGSVSGIVESARLVDVPERTPIFANGTDINLELVIVQRDGVRAYASARVAERVSKWQNGLASSREVRTCEWGLSDPLDTNSWPLLVDLHATIFAGDQILITGGVESRTSAKGNEYLSVKGIKVLGLRRPEGGVWGNP